MRRIFCLVASKALKVIFLFNLPRTQNELPAFFLCFSKTLFGGLTKRCMRQKRVKTNEKDTAEYGCRIKMPAFLQQAEVFIIYGRKTDFKKQNGHYASILPLAFLRFAFRKLMCYCLDQYLLQYLSPFSH